MMDVGNFEIEYGRIVDVKKCKFGLMFSADRGYYIKIVTDQECQVTYETNMNAMQMYNSCVRDIVIENPNKIVIVTDDSPITVHCERELQLEIICMYLNHDDGMYESM